MVGGGVGAGVSSGVDARVGAGGAGDARLCFRRQVRCFLPKRNFV